jgi:hypothetical protein
MNLINIIKEEYNLIKEYITREVVYLKDYLSMPEEKKKEYLPHEYSYLFDDFLIETDTEFEKPKETRPSNYADEPDEEVDMFETNYELINWLEKNNKQLFDSFADYLYNRIKYNDLPIGDEEYPAWSYFSDSVQLVKKHWLIHFTDDADGIAKEGFKYGVDDMSKLGLTTRLGEFEKKYGGYNFAYTLDDFVRYGRNNNRSRGYKYGKEAVVFKASGIKVYHYGDEEPQVIFYGNTANNIIPITSGEEADWAIYSTKNGEILFENNNLEVVVKWLVNNYNQYKKSL